jgi:hypothetical protein
MDLIEQGMELESSNIGRKEYDIEYHATEVESFKEAVEEIEKDSKGKKRFCMVDVDGTMIGNEITQYPGLCYFEQPYIGKDVEESFPTLVGIFKHNNICIATNRDPRVEFPWDSKGLMSVVQNYLNGFESKIPSFTSLNKQLASTKIAIGERELMVDYIVDYIKELDVRDELTLYSIQDRLPVYFNRKVIKSFPVEISKMIIDRVRKDLNRDISVEIKDYVIRK